MTANKFMIGVDSIYHEASSPDSGYDMEMSLLGLKMEREDQENVDEDDDEEDDECEESFGDRREVERAKDTKTEGEVSNMAKQRHGNRKHDGHIGNGSGNRKKRYSRARSSRARSPTQVGCSRCSESAFKDADSNSEDPATCRCMLGRPRMFERIFTT